MSTPALVDVSVLMPVHAAVQAAHFAAALDSVASQSATPREVVVVVDGPVPASLAEVLAARDPWVTRVDLHTQGGAGLALAVGLGRCSSTWVARADADDLNMPERLQVQLEQLRRDGADVCSAAMTEFVGSPENRVGVRRAHVDHADFARLMRFRNPVNHPTVVFRREVALRAGGYQALPYLEDYDLWARMLAAGARFTGVDRPLVAYRADGMLERRTNAAAIRAERELQRRLRLYGLVGPVRSRLNWAVRVTYLRLPMWALRRAYRRVFRLPPGSADAA